MNSAITTHRRRKTGTMTRIVLFISFLILFSRLIIALPAAFEHHQQKKVVTEPAVTLSTSEIR